MTDSDSKLSEKNHSNINIYEKNPNFKGKSSFKKRCNFCRRYGHSIAECRQELQDNKSKPKNLQNQINHFTNT